LRLTLDRLSCVTPFKMATKRRGSVHETSKNVKRSNEPGDVFEEVGSQLVYVIAFLSNPLHGILLRDFRLVS